jgi:branched-chain amino acid transport system substrate-binding protein
MRKSSVQKIKFFMYFVVAIFVSVTILVASDENVWAQQSKLEAYKVGVIAPISGPGSAMGKYFTQAIEIETKYLNEGGGINGIPLKLFIEDDQSNPSVALVATKKQIQSSMVCILGSVLTNNVLAMIPEIEKEHVPDIASGAGRQIIDPLRKWVFKVPHTDTKVNAAMLKFAKESLKVKKIAVLFQDDAYGMSGAKQMKEQAPKFGISIASEESFHASDTNMVPQLTKISRTDADVILIHSFIGPGAIIAKNAYQVGLKIPLIYSTGAVSETLIQVAGTAAEGLYFVGIKPTIGEYLSQDDPQKFYYDRFQKRLKNENIKFDTFHGNGHDAANLLGYALKQLPAGTTDTQAIREGIQRGLEKVKNLPLHNATYTFTPEDHDGATAESLVMVKVKDGKFVPLK